MAIFFYGISVERGQFRGPLEIRNFHPPSNVRRFDPPLSRSPTIEWGSLSTSPRERCASARFWEDEVGPLSINRRYRSIVRGKRPHRSGKKKAHKLKKNPRDTGRVSLGHLAGQTGVYRPVCQGFPVVCYRKTDIFAGTPAGCPRDTQPSRGLSEILCVFFLCAFSAP